METQTKHTPGPWKYHIGHSAGIVTADDNKPVVDGGGVTEYRREWEANARLIAAAPDLLKAAKYVVSGCTCNALNHIDLLKSAIAKAEGGGN